jgi:hypothetical protein
MHHELILLCVKLDDPRVSRGGDVHQQHLDLTPGRDPVREERYYSLSWDRRATQDASRRHRVEER